MVYEREVSHSWFMFDPIDSKCQRRLVGMGRGSRDGVTLTGIEGGKITVYLYKPCCSLAPSNLSLLPFAEKQLVPKQYLCFKICFWSCLLLFVCGLFCFCFFLLFCVCKWLFVCLFVCFVCVFGLALLLGFYF